VSIDIHALPADETSAAALATRGLRYGTVDVADAAAFDAWLQSEARGFHGAEQTAAQLAATRAGLAYRRTTAVWDGAAPRPDEPVATASSWLGELTVPGGSILPSWAVSFVSVAATHRRRGVARALLEGELRTAVSAGAPMAMLTVTEATIYGRFGFGPAASTTSWRIDTRRARYAGPDTTSAVHFIERDEVPDELDALHDRLRRTRSGDVGAWRFRWQQLAGLVEPDAEPSRRIRAIRAADADGATRGIAVYAVREDEADFTKHAVDVLHLEAETPDAYRAMWRHVLELDLVSEVRAHLRAADEPLRWLLSDPRGAVVETRDHQWLRILDVPAALSARAWSAPGRVVLDVVDELGFAAGRWSLEVDGAGAATVSPAPVDEPVDVALHVRALSSLYLGGATAASLAAAGLADGSADAIGRLDRMLAAETPWLTIWY
jgi:predicted acetyltransferase